ncbi:alpha/beta fold hydrolase [Deinococcus oregonensis]|uniref:Alpha/beta fold hydrolase n=1 Tax=Deinococcus oregonensis TaxID=1805970 RepID=A0ABV6AVU1_9DEIO
MKQGIVLLALSLSAVQAGAAQPTGSFVTVDPGVQLYVQQLGTGQPVIFVPGWTMTGDFFQKQLPVFAQQYRAVTFDPRGQGRSTKTTLGSTYAAHGVDLSRLMNRLGLKNVLLVGWSYGCLDAYSYLHQFGTRNVKAFVCVDQTPKSLGLTSDAWAEGDAATLAGLTQSLAPSHGAFMAGYAEYMLGRKNKAEIDWVVQQSLKTPNSVARLLFADGTARDYSQTARNVSKVIPTLALVRQDWSAAALKWLGANTPAAKTAVVPNHMAFWTEPGQFNRLLQGFFDTLR